MQLHELSFPCVSCDYYTLHIYNLFRIDKRLLTAKVSRLKFADCISIFLVCGKNLAQNTLFRSRIEPSQSSLIRTYSGGGISFQRSPVISACRMPLIIFQSSARFLPTIGCGGMCDSINFHCSLLSSANLIATPLRMPISQMTFK